MLGEVGEVGESVSPGALAGFGGPANGRTA